MMEIITVEVSLSQGYKSPGDPVIRIHCLHRHSHNVLFNVIKIYLVCFSPAQFFADVGTMTLMPFRLFMAYL